MRATEFIDFINRKSLDGIELYSHLETREENEDKKMVLQEKYKLIRRKIRKQRRQNGGK